MSLSPRVLLAPSGLAVGLLLVCLGGSSAADRTQRFVAALRAEGHTDLVLEYLDRAESDPLVSDQFRERIPYERLTTGYAEAVALRDPTSRKAALEALLPDARDLASSDPDASRLVTNVLDRVATAAADGARLASIAARRAPEVSRREALAGSRDQLQEARALLGEAEQAIVQERERLKGVQPDSPDGRRRADLRFRLGLIQLQHARMLHEIAQTHPAKSARRKRLNSEAADELRSLYEQDPKSGVGQWAHLFEGRCYRLLGKRQLAAAALEDVTYGAAAVAEFRPVVTRAHAELAALRREQGDAAGALDKPGVWLEGLSASEANTSEGAELRYRLAQAALARADQLDGAAAQRLRRQAREWLELSSRTPSEVQSEVRALWANVAASMGVDTTDLKSFEEAFQAGAEAIQTMVALDVKIESAARDERQQLVDQRAESRAAAYAALTTATKLADDKTDPEQAAQARYQVAWLDWDAGDASQAATRGEYVARRDAATASAQDAARLALAAWERLEREGEPGASERLRSFASYVAATWKGSEVAQSAGVVLVASALRSGDLESARAVLQSAPAGQRAELALRLALADWERSKSSDAQRALDTALNEAVRDGQASPLAVTAALYLAEAALGAGGAADARRLLNDDRYGPAVRLRAGEPPSDNPAVALAILKLVVRVDAAAGRPIEESLERIATILASTPTEQTGGPRAWLALAAAVSGDLDRAAEPVAGAGGAFSSVLDRLSEVEDTGDWNTRLWVAQARLRCGELRADAAAARDDLAAGAESLRGLVALAGQDPQFAPSKTAVLAARLRLAQCQRRLEDYEGSLESLTEILRGGAALLEVQQEAAEVLQAWGVQTEDPRRVEQALTGCEPGESGKNLIWGWSKLAAIAGRYAAGDPKRRALFFEAWRNVAACRLSLAQMASGAERKKQLGKAASTILALQRQNPELGGEASRRAFDLLLRDIQSASGTEPTGLADLGG